MTDLQLAVHYHVLHLSQTLHQFDAFAVTESHLNCCTKELLY